jgi:hypothetical protein
MERRRFFVDLIQYTFLHEGILRGYLSKLGECAKDAAVYWRYGCWFFEQKTRSQVLIESQSTSDLWGKRRNFSCPDLRGRENQRWLPNFLPKVCVRVNRGSRAQDFLKRLDGFQEPVRLKSALRAALDNQLQRAEFVQFWPNILQQPQS